MIPGRSSSFYNITRIVIILSFPFFWPLINSKFCFENWTNVVIYWKFSLKARWVPQRTLDKNVIDSIFKNISGNQAKETHLIYAGHYYLNNEDVLRSLILEGMKKYNIKGLLLVVRIYTSYSMNHKRPLIPIRGP